MPGRRPEIAANSTNADPEKQAAIGNDSEKQPLIGKGRGTATTWIHSFFPWLGLLHDQYGGNILVFLVISMTGVRGLANHLCGQSRRWLYREYHIPGPQMQVFEGVVHIPWSLQPLIGFISDLYPVRGYHKAPYMVLTSILAVGAWACIGLGNSKDHTVTFTVLCLFLGKVQVCVVDLLTQAKYAEELKKTPEHAPDLLSYVWTCITFGDIVAGVICGWIIVTWGCRAPYLLAMIPAALILYPIMRNYMNETPRTIVERDRIRTLIAGQCEVTFLCAILTICSLVLAVLGISDTSKRQQFIGAFIVMIVVLVSFSVTLRPKIARMNAFFMIQSMLCLSVSGATFYFYTNTEKQYAQGPHFSVQFYNTILSCVASLFSLVGIYLYNKTMRDWNFQTIMLVSNILCSLCALGDCVLFTRYNLKLGIPDTAFVLGSSISESILWQWQMMPGIVMLSQFCPEGMEATMYALLAGCSNLGWALSEFFGAYLLEVLEVRPAGLHREDHQFDKLWVASLMSTVLPMLTLILIPCCIPNAKQTDTLPEEERNRPITEGSLWRKWCGE